MMPAGETFPMGSIHGTSVPLIFLGYINTSKDTISKTVVCVTQESNDYIHFLKNEYITYHIGKIFHCYSLYSLLCCNHHLLYNLSL